MMKVKITVGGYAELARMAQHLADNCIDDQSVTMTVPFKKCDEHRAKFVMHEAGNAGMTACVEQQVTGFDRVKR